VTKKSPEEKRETLSEFYEAWYEYIGDGELPPAISNSSIVGPNDTLRYAPRDIQTDAIRTARRRPSRERKNQNPANRQ
jgi:hypothetical protein